jgi:MATE family multidrug resistance protein
MQMFFLVGLFTGQLAFRVLGTTGQAANQIALSLASLTMFAMGLSVVTIRVEIRKD